MAEKVITVALAGNPNSGKTTIFNALTGAKQHVGNYPGVTVEKKEGVRVYDDYKIKFIDLPGTYSLAANSVEEVVARDFIIDDNPDIVAVIVDASNFERNLYLATQILELNKPMIICLNMADVAKKQGYSFDTTKIGKFFNAEAVLTVGLKSQGIDELLKAIIKKYHTQYDSSAAVRVRYGQDIENELEKTQQLLSGIDSSIIKKYGERWLSLKLIERDEQITKLIKDEKITAAVKKSVEHLEKLYNDVPEVLIAEKRYGFISGVYEQAVKHNVQVRHEISDTIDKVLLNRALGLPIFLAMMYMVFKLTFWLGGPFMEYIEIGFNWLGRFVSGFWPEASESVLKSLLVDGVIGGVGGVIIFLPNIILLFLAISLLEDSGYMARAAFLMDKIMKKIGLHGRSFIPMMIGFGCSIPAIMGTRIIDDRKSRFTTIMVLPLMSCGARLPIYALIIPAFFAPRWHGFIMWLMYMIGIVLAIIISWILRRSILKGDSGVFLMELPPYRLPTVRGLLTHMWQRSWLYVKKAGTVILAISIVLWAATSYPKPDTAEKTTLTKQQYKQLVLENSVAGRIGKAMEPVIKPMGFDYRIGTALIGAVAAKEVFVAQMGIVFSVGQNQGGSETLRAKLRDNYSPLQGFCVMLFCLISAPCMATVAVCKRETGSWIWALFQFFGLTAIAYIITVAVYQIGQVLL